MRGSKENKRTSLKVNRQKGEGAVRIRPGVHSFMAREYPIHGAQFNTTLSESERIHEGKNLYSKESELDADMPELVVFFQDSNYQFVKDIFMDREVHSQDENVVENYELDHNIISCMLNSEVNIYGESTNKTLGTEASISNESKVELGHEAKMGRIKLCGSENLMMDGDEDFDAIEYILNDHSTKKIKPATQLVREVPTRNVFLANSMVLAATEAIGNNSHTSEAFLKSKFGNRSIIHHSDSSIATISGIEEFLQSADFQQPLETEGMSRLEDGISECLSSSSQRFFHQDVNGEYNSFAVDSLSGSIAYSGSVTYSGSISHRSNSSIASSHSFAFPTLPSEWNGSPVRMAKAEPRQLRRLPSWRMLFPCCKF